MCRLSGLTLLFVVLGCESILEIELEHVDPEIVVTSVFTENIPWQVVIQRTIGIQEDSSHPSIIDHAAVTIEGSDGSFVELIHKGGGFYYGDTSLPQPGVMYTLKVEVEGYGSIEASDQIPSYVKPPDIRHFGSDKLSEVTLYDEAGAENYYAISMLSRNMDWMYFSVLNPELEDQIKRFALQDPFSPYVNRPDVSAVLIHDKPFDGKQFDLTLSKIFRENNLSTYVSSVSKAYYDYYLSKIVQKNSENLSIVEPAPLRSNVHGGHGIFAGYRLYVDGVLTPKNIRNQIIGTYDLSDTQTQPIDSTIKSDEIEFTLHPDQSVTGFMKYSSQTGSVLVSLEGGFTITDHGLSTYLVQLHHDADTFFRNAELRISILGFSNPNISLSTNQEAIDRNGTRNSIARTFLKRDSSDDK